MVLEIKEGRERACQRIKDRPKLSSIKLSEPPRSGLVQHEIEVLKAPGNVTAISTPIQVDSGR
jgi:hypothetical protein